MKAVSWVCVGLRFVCFKSYRVLISLQFWSRIWMEGGSLGGNHAEKSTIWRFQNEAPDFRMEQLLLRLRFVSKFLNNSSFFLTFPSGAAIDLQFIVSYYYFQNTYHLQTFERESLIFWDLYILLRRFLYPFVIFVAIDE